MLALRSDWVVFNHGRVLRMATEECEVCRKATGVLSV